MTRRVALLRLLADGGLHSGEELAARLSVTRAAVWKQLHLLAQWGIEVQATPGRGYRLPRPVDLLDADEIRDALPQFGVERLRRLEVHEALPSTSDRLLATDDLAPGCFDVCLAEYQTAGRGRRGRHWLAPWASGMCLSLNWGFRDTPAALGALPLAAGVAVLRALRRLGIRGLRLKWPNDIVYDGRKLGGILVDLRGEAAGPAYVVVGVGINVRLPDPVLAQLRAAGVEATDLASLAAPGLRRNRLAAALINELALALEEFAGRGFAAFVDEWRAADALIDQLVGVREGATIVNGLARGVDVDGALLIEAGGARRRVLAGEVSVRPLR